MTHFFNNKQVLMENVSFQDLTPKSKLFRLKKWLKLIGMQIKDT